MADTATPTELQMLTWVPSFEESEMDRKEKEILESHRVRLTEYIHDAAALFPYMKEKRVFTVDDCEIIQHCATARLRMDKCIDILFTKGPNAIGTFHEALARSYPMVFDFLTRLFTKHGVDLPDSRKMKPEEDFYQLQFLDSDESGRANSIERQNTLPADFRERRTNRFTIRKRLEVLSKQCESIQQERDNLKNALSEREKEISELLRSKEVSFHNLVSITQKYQHLYSELVQWKESLTVQSEDSDKRLQQVIDEREQIEQDYATLENDFVLCQSELCAARDRISRLMTHLERSEKMVAVMQEAKDGLQGKVDSLELEKQFMQRKITRLVQRPGSKESPEQDNTKKEIELLRSELEEMTDRLKAARLERSQAIEEKESFLQKYYMEKKMRTEAENKLTKVRKRSRPDIYGTSSPEPPDWFSAMNVKMEDSSIRMQAADDVGMRLSLAVMVREVSDRSIAARSGIRAGDLILEVNHLMVGTDPNPLEFVGRVLRTATSYITLTVRRPTISFPGQSNNTDTYNPHSHTLPLPRVHQIHSPDVTKTSTLPPFSLPVARPGALWESGISYRTDINCHVTTPTGVSRGIKSTGSSCPSTPATNSSGDADTISSKGYGTGDRPRLIRQALHQEIDSDTASNHTSTSSNQDDYCISDTAPKDGHSLVQSPTLPRQFTLDDNILPSSVTRPPTLRHHKQNASDSFPQELAMRLANLAESPTEYQHQLSSPSYFSQSSNPEFGEIIPLSPTTVSKPLQRRPANRRIRDKMRRLSQSSPDLGNLDSESTKMDLTLPEPKNRMVVLGRGQLSKGITLIGGRGRGLFISSTKPGSATQGLQTGDQLIKVGSELASTLTYADAIRRLEECSMSGEDCKLLVQHNMNAFHNLPNTDVRDSFYVKALFTNRRPREGELVFARGDMFHVVDTLPGGGVKGVWQAYKVDQFGNETEHGLIPVDQQPSETDVRVNSLPAMAPPRRLRKSPVLGTTETLPDSSARNSVTSVYELYQPMRRKDATLPRPVVVVGVLDNEVIQNLAADPDFSICPEETIGSTVMLHDSSCGEFVVLKREEEVHYCMVNQIKQLASKGKHCIIPLDRSNLRALATPFSELSQLHPIVIFLHTSKFTMAIMSFLHKVTDVSRYSQETKSLMEQYSHLFSATVDVAGGVENTSRLVKLEIKKQQQTAIWVTDT